MREKQIILIVTIHFPLPPPPLFSSHTLFYLTPLNNRQQKSVYICIYREACHYRHKYIYIYSDRTKQICLWMTIYIYIYIYMREQQHIPKYINIQKHTLWHMYTQKPIFKERINHINRLFFVNLHSVWQMCKAWNLRSQTLPWNIYIFSLKKVQQSATLRKIYFYPLKKCWYKSIL